MILRRNLFFMISRVVTIFVAGMVVAVTIALSQVNLETLRGNIAAILQDATGMPVEINGKVSWKLSLRPRIELNQVRVLNAQWAHHKYAFSADKIDVTINLLSLFRDRPTIQNVKIYDASVCIEQDANGKYSAWVRPDAKQGATDKNAKTTPAKSAQTKQTPAKPAPKKYPFEDPGLGGIEVKNLVAHIIDDTYSLAGLQIRYAPSKDHREYTGWIKSNGNVFPFIVSYSEYNAERRIYPVRVAVSSGGKALIANVALEGKSRLPIDFIIKGDIPDITAVGEIFNLDLTQMPLMTVNIAGGFNNKKITLRKSSIAVRDNVIKLSGDYDWSKKIPNINLNVDAGKVNLTQLFPGFYYPNRKWHRPDRELNVFKNIPLYGKEYLKFNMNLWARVEDLIVYRDLSIRDIDLTAKLKDGHSRIDARLSMADGDIQVGADIDIAMDGHMNGRAAAIGERIFVGEILRQLRITDWISDLPANAELYVTANGSDLSEVMQSITGPVYVYSVGAGYAHSALVSNIYGADFLTSIRHSIQDLFRTEKKYNLVKISCAAVNAKLRNGRVETQNGVAVESNVVNVRLAGTLNLGGEKMRLGLTTVPVRGLKLSLSGNVANVIEISGNLAEPDVKINGAAIAGKVASATGLGLLLAPFTGGVGLVAGAGIGLVAGDLLENWLADDTPCKTAMKRGAPLMQNDPEWMGAPMAQLVRSVLKNDKQGE